MICGDTINTFADFLKQTRPYQDTRSAIASTYFMTALEAHGNEHAATYMSKDMDDRSICTILVPVHLPDELHWALIVVDLIRGALLWYDSLWTSDGPAPVGPDDPAKPQLDRLERFLQQQCRIEGDPQEWKQWRMPTWLQTDTTNCGLLVMMRMFTISTGTRVQCTDQSRSISPVRATTYRERLALLLLLRSPCGLGF